MRLIFLAVDSFEMLKSIVHFQALAHACTQQLACVHAQIEGERDAQVVNMPFFYT